MAWRLKPPGELLDRGRPQGIHRGDPERADSTHARGGSFGRGAAWHLMTGCLVFWGIILPSYIGEYNKPV